MHIFDERCSKTAFRGMLRELSKLLDLRGKRVLDIGCSTGSDMTRFSRLGASCFGIDKDKRCVPGRFLLSDAANLPFRSETFDIVSSKFLLDLLEWQNKVDPFLEEAFRVLKPGGLLIIVHNLLLSDLGYFSLQEKVNSLGFQVVQMREDHGIIILKKPARSEF